MIFVEAILTLYAVSILIIMSLTTTILLFWLLFFNKFSRFKIARILIIIPWVFIINNLLLFMRIKIKGHEFVDPKRKSLYICNHQSWFDITTFIRYSKATAVAKEEVKLIPFLGPITVYTGNLFFKRENRGDRLSILKEVRTLFEKNKSLCLFPEGSRNVGGELLPPNLALIKLCYKMNICVVPAAIEGTRFIMPKGKFLFKFFQKVYLEYKQPVLPENFKNADEFANHCWAVVSQTYNTLKENY